MAQRSRSAEHIRSARLRVIGLTNMIGAVVSSLIKWGGLCYIAYSLRMSVGTIAGKETIFSFVAKLGANVTANQWAAYLFGGTGVAYGIAQRRLRKRTVANVSKRVQDLEKQIDPNRSSSGLSSGGTTPIDY